MYGYFVHNDTDHYGLGRACYWKLKSNSGGNNLQTKEHKKTDIEELKIHTLTRDFILILGPETFLLKLPSVKVNNSYKVRPRK